MKDTSIRLNSRFKDKYVFVTDFDEEDWQHLFLADLWEPFEEGKSFLRVN
jgi:hypothetical protein